MATIEGIREDLAAYLAGLDPDVVPGPLAAVRHSLAHVIHTTRYGVLSGQRSAMSNADGAIDPP